LLRKLSQFVGILLATAPVALSQGTAAPHQKPALAKPETSVVTSINVVHEGSVPALEILSTLPSVPTIQFVDSPPRLVIDLLHASLAPKLSKIDVHEQNILGVRAEQHQADPAVVRIVLDLLAPYSYTWDEAGNRLMVRLKPPESAPSGKKPGRSSTASGGAGSLGVVPVNAGAAGLVTLGGRSIVSGSSLTTAADTAILQLSRGGEVKLCPRTTVSVTPSRSSKELMLGMSTGALETHYALQTSADTVLTPDFRILFSGPGEFDFAVSTDAHGDTCVRGLVGNTSSAIVSELMGDRTYLVKPNEQVVFRAGQIDKLDHNVPLECGCASPPPVLRAEAATPAGTVPPNTKLELGPGKEKPSPAQPASPSVTGDVKVQVDAPLVFRGGTRSHPTNPSEEIFALPVLEVPASPPQLGITIQPPPSRPAQPSSAPHRFVRRLKGIFSALFS
jgi:hypothetical protein